MGLHNRITKDKYNQIKRFLNENKSKFKKTENLDEAACKKFGISRSSARSIRNTKDYAEYCERVFRYHGHPKKGTTAKAEHRIKYDKDNSYPILLLDASKQLASLDSLCIQLDGDHQAIIENQLNISRRLRIHTILNCVLVFIVATTIALLAWRISW